MRALGTSGFCLAVVGALVFLLWGTIAVSAGAPVLRQEVAPTSTRPPPPPLPSPTLEPAFQAPTGGLIELRVHFPDDWPWDQGHWQDLWTVVQWQDRLGDWHIVEGWRGELDRIAIVQEGAVVGYKAWWVAHDDLDKGPFRWLVYRSDGGDLLASSPPFYLPEIGGATAWADVSLVAPGR